MRDLQAARGTSLTPDPSSGTPEPAAPDSVAQHGVASDSAAPSRAAPRTSRRHTTGLLAAAAVVVIGLDVLTKQLVVAHLEHHDPVRLLGGALLLNVSRNSGAAFSFAQGATLVFTAVAVAVIVVIGRTARRLGSKGWAISLGLLLGGATGNLLDRIFRAPGPGRGAVVDFIDFRVWPVFNLADSAIVCGGALAVLLSIRGIELDGTRKADHAPDPPEPDPA